MPLLTSRVVNKTVHVAIGVIHFGAYYLLGFRHAKQHQGNRYEFIGGKVEPNETPRQALEREIAEEIGVIIPQDDNNRVNRLGVLQHSYNSEHVHSEHIAGDEQAVSTQSSTSVCLHVYRVTLSEAQYQRLATQTQGCEQQPLKWVMQSELVNNRYVLPEANTPILEWLKLGDIITVTCEPTDAVIATGIIKTQPITLANVRKNSADSGEDDTQRCVKRATERQNMADWLEFQQLYLPQNGCVYVRLKTLSLWDEATAILQLIDHRPDLSLIVHTAAAVAISQGLLSPIDEGLTSNDSTYHPLTLNAVKAHKTLPRQIIAQHLTQASLDNIDTLDNMDAQDANSLLSQVWHPTLPLTLSCHDQKSIQKANTLAQTRLNNQQSPAIAMFLSPVMATQSHPTSTPLGWRHFEHLANHANIPVIALGGLTPDNLLTARHYGADKIAGIRQFYQS